MEKILFNIIIIMISLNLIHYTLFIIYKINKKKEIKRFSNLIKDEKGFINYEKLLAIHKRFFISKNILNTKKNFTNELLFLISKKELLGKYHIFLQLFRYIVSELSQHPSVKKEEINKYKKYSNEFTKLNENLGIYKEYEIKPYYFKIDE